ncbi:MAG: PD-(D/E)XK nuclease family protein [bacterium]|nr:PD-(D/E)XK nuclease family protein [bacterium]
MDLPRDYISYSQIRLYQGCPRKYYYSYIKRIPVPINDKVYLGIIFHSAVEYYLGEKINGKVPVKDRVLENFADSFDKRLEKMDIVWDNTQADTRKRGLAFVRYFMKEIAPHLKPIMVEKELIADLPGIGVKLKGVIDMVEEDFSITDFKTTTAKWDKNRVKNSYLQIVIYRYLFEKAFGDVISQLKFKIVYAKKLPNIRHQEVAIKPRDVDYGYDKMFDIIKYVVDGITGEVFYKNVNFSCGFCQFKDVCKNDSDREPDTD